MAVLCACLRVWPDRLAKEVSRRQLASVCPNPSSQSRQGASSSRHPSDSGVYGGECPAALPRAPILSASSDQRPATSDYLPPTSITHTSACRFSVV